MKFLAILLLVCLALLAPHGVIGDSISGQGCSVSMTITARPNSSYRSGSSINQIYDIVITNNGRCSADNIAININLASGSITQQWNLVTGSGYYTVTSFGSTLPVGNSVNAGIVVTFPNTQTVPANAVSTSMYRTLCPSQCVNSQQATTSAMSSTATTSSIPPASTTTGSPSGTGSCKASIVLTARSGGSYPSGSGMSQIYDATITNTGSCGLTRIALQLAIPAGAAISSTWNLEVNGGMMYTLTSYGGLLQMGSTANAGFIVTFPNTQTIPSGVTATTSSTTCVASCSGQGTGSGSSTSSGTAMTSTSGAQTGSCRVNTAITPRSGSSWQTGSGVSQIYDIVVTNSGSCAVNNIILQATLPAGASIQSTWNLNYNGNLQYTVTSYEGTLPAGSAVNAGIVVTFPNTQTVPGGVGASATTTTCNRCQ